MPSDDLILNVKQINGYPLQPVVNGPSASIVFQSGGLGGPYYSAAADMFVASALAASPLPLLVGLGPASPAAAFGSQVIADWFSGRSYVMNGYLAANQTFTALNQGFAAFIDLDVVNGEVTWGITGAQVNAGAQTLFNTVMTLDHLGNLDLPFGSIAVAQDPVLANAVATKNYVDTMSVSSFNGRVGAVRLYGDDILAAGGAPINSPRFDGSPRANTPPPSSNSSRLATTAWVQQNTVGYLSDLLACHPFVFTLNGLSGDVVLTSADIVGVTPPAGDNSTALATTAWVQSLLATGYAPLASPVFTGNPTAPTAATGSSTGQIATTAFVHNALAASVAGVASFNTRTGAVVLTAADLTGAGGALSNNAALTGIPTAPTATVGTQNTQIATTAFVASMVAATGVSSFNTRTGAVVLTTGDITGAGGAALNSPTFTGLPAAPTASPGTLGAQIATCGFVAAAIIAAGGVSAFNGRTGAVTFNVNDLSAVGGALLASPAFTGTPTAPTAAPGTSTTQIATTAFVAALFGATSIVNTFNGRTGAITLTSGDITAAGGAALVSPAFTGTPTAPTPALGVNTTQIATCAWVLSELGGGSGGVVSFNGRNGAITLLSTDISAAGGALLASPQFTGAPSAPTASVGTNSQQLATTAFVLANIPAIPAASTLTPTMNGTATAGVATTWSRGDHVHPVDTSRAAQASLANYLPLTGGNLTGALGVAIGGVGVALTNPSGSPAVTLQSGGTTRTSLFWNTSSQVSTFQHVGGGPASYAMDNTGTGYVSGNLNVAGTVSQGSDRRGKRAIIVAEDGIEVVRDLQPKRFARNDSDRVELGFIAQEVETVLEEAVLEGPLTGLLGLDTTPLIAVLVNAVKHLDARLAALETRTP
jgi:Chaperone of endosialidase